MDSEIDENSVDSCTSNLDNAKQKCNDILDDNKTVAVVCVMIADDKSFTLTPFLTNSYLSISPTIKDLSETLNNVLIIDDNNTYNYSVMSLSKKT